MPETKEQRCWFHKMGNVIDKLPKRLQRKARKLLREIVDADSRDGAEEAIAAFESEFAPKHQRAVDCLVKDGEKLLTLYEFPAEQERDEVVVPERDHQVRGRGALRERQTPAHRRMIGPNGARESVGAEVATADPGCIVDERAEGEIHFARFESPRVATWGARDDERSRPRGLRGSSPR